MIHLLTFIALGALVGHQIEVMHAEWEATTWRRLLVQRRRGIVWSQVTVDEVTR